MKKNQKDLRVPISQPIAIDSKQAKTVLENAWKYLHTKLSKLEHKKQMGIIKTGNLLESVQNQVRFDQAPAQLFHVFVWKGFHG